jgi:hypothetical protein
MVSFTQEEDDEESEWEQTCAVDQKNLFVFHAANIFHYFGIVRLTLFVRCEYDKCNTMGILGTAMAILDKEYSTSSLLQELGYELGEVEETSSTKPLMSSSTQAQSASSSSTTSLYRNNSTTTTRGASTPKSTGQNVQSTNAMIYLSLLICMVDLIVRPFI